ncbi:hypothetical protein [Streptomyces xiaopingdaonensis]|uniref:hypothetical protein n=1 Tax=Streptomyces xiaopingdaonensis TaxID=1565415 RepID=UPI00138AF3DC|nr:hypothetical protein [Streptomyces xiaopingdaonensis]
MDWEPPSEACGADLEHFVRDLALCLSVHRGKSPALVWPDGIDAVVACGRTGGGSASPSAERDGDEKRDESSELTRALGAALGTEVSSSWVELPLGAESIGNTAETDLVLAPVRGSCGGRVEASPPGQVAAVLNHPLELRLLAGQALYVPRGFVYTLNNVHTPCTLQVFALHPSTGSAGPSAPGTGGAAGGP